MNVLKDHVANNNDNIFHCRANCGFSVMSLDSGMSGVLCVCVFFIGSRVLFTGPASMKFNKFYFKTGSHAQYYSHI